jgi:hypothetical protein
MDATAGGSNVTDETDRTDRVGPLDAIVRGDGGAADDPFEMSTPTRGDGLPEHEHDDARTIGGGMMGQGGTAVDRGTGTLAGDAQGTGGEDGDDDSGTNADFGADDADAALGRDR